MLCWIALADGGMALLLQEAIYQLLRLAGLLEALPLPAGSAQADLVAASISQKATLAEREVPSRAQPLTQTCTHPWVCGTPALRM